jgi:hypothetical protein
MVAFNYTRLTERSMALVQSLLWFWKSTLDPRYLIDLLIGDENHEMWKYDVYASAMASYVKKIRMIGAAIVLNSHGTRDYLASGSSYAANMLNDVSCWFIGRVVREEALSLQVRLNLSDPITEYIQHMRVGQFLVVIPNKSMAMFQLHLTANDLVNTDSDHAVRSMLGMN